MIMMTEPDKTTYWQRVETALEIIGVRPDLALELRRDVNNLSERQQELFYHAEPLDIARDISGITQLSSEQLERYLELQKEPTKIQPDSLLEVLREPLISSTGRRQVEVSNVVRLLEQEMMLRALAEKSRLSESERRVLSRLMEFETTSTRRTAIVVGGVGLLTAVGVLGAWFAIGSITAIMVTISLLVSIGSILARDVIAVHFLWRSVADKKTSEDADKKIPVR